MVPIDGSGGWFLSGRILDRWLLDGWFLDGCRLDESFWVCSPYGWFYGDVFSTAALSAHASLMNASLGGTYFTQEASKTTFSGLPPAGAH